MHACVCIHRSISMTFRIHLSNYCEFSVEEIFFLELIWLVSVYTRTSMTTNEGCLLVTCLLHQTTTKVTRSISEAIDQQTKHTRVKKKT